MPCAHTSPRPARVPAVRPETDPQIAAEFWAEQRRIRERREEILAMPNQVERFEAILADTWTVDSILSAFESVDPFAVRDLDDWLAEDGVPEIGEALGL